MRTVPVLALLLLAGCASVGPVTTPAVAGPCWPADIETSFLTWPPSEARDVIAAALDGSAQHLRLAVYTETTSARAVGVAWHRGRPIVIDPAAHSPGAGQVWVDLAYVDETGRMRGQPEGAPCRWQRLAGPEQKT